MISQICSDISLLQKQAQYDALGIEIFLNKITLPFYRNYFIFHNYFILRKVSNSLKKYLKTYDLNVCAKCHSFEDCSKAFFKTYKNLLSVLDEFLPGLEEGAKNLRGLWPLNNSIKTLIDCQEELEDRVENMEIILATKDGVLNEIGSALDEAESKLENWRQALPFLQ